MRVSSLSAIKAAALIAVLSISAAAQKSGKATPKKVADKNPARSTVPDKFQLPPAPIEQYTLDNGLRVILSRDTSVPVVSVAVYYNVGSRDEREGRTGFAHLFEHMMYQGSENVAKGEYMKHIQNAGGTLNGNTTTERTAYFATLPSNQLPLALWLESDRMRSLKVTQENLDNQREVVKEEKRFRIDNQPYVPAFIRFSEMVFGNFANAHPTIGSMEDLNAANLQDVKEFFRIYYAPNNAVLTIAGDFDIKESRQLVDKYFKTIPRQSAPPAVNVSEAANVVKRNEVFEDRFAPMPAFLTAWKIPARRTQDFYALSLAGSLLFEGDSSRLYQKLVKGDESVVQVQGGIDERRGPSAFYILVLPKPGQDEAAIRQTVMAEITRLGSEGPTAEEMEKLHNGLRNEAARSRQTSIYRAQRIAEFALFDGDPNLFNSEFDRYTAISPAQIKDAVTRLLVTDNRSLLEIIQAKPKSSPGSSPPSGESKQMSYAPARRTSAPATSPTKETTKPSTRGIQ
jgi:predicted Zn-dependent peptidase